MISLKINFKLGGTNHQVKTLGVKKNTMIVGADVTHPRKIMDPNQYEPCPSMAGVVATSDLNHAHYLASARLQKGKTEVREMSSYVHLI